MITKASNKLNGAQCKVIDGTHAGKSGTVRDIKTSKTGHITITVVQANGEGSDFGDYFMPEVSLNTERKDKKIIASEIP
ncbi:MAG: hypothetical protein EXS51_01275 [Candidatus Taylorbacteria bacterium]|nr:hypothetical protein [Candidatus Taylorbacteria bacterium]